MLCDSGPAEKPVIEVSVGGPIIVSESDEITPARPAQEPAIVDGGATPGAGIANPSGLLIVDKPLGWSSMDVCRKVRWAVKRGLPEGIGRRKIKVGHAGTLDPLATGVVAVVGVYLLSKWTVTST